MSLILTIGTKKYSSWSLRPWGLLVQCDIPFVEKKIEFSAIPGKRDFDQEFKRAAFAEGPTGRVPLLREGSLVVWESLSICSYVASKFPEKRLWPTGRAEYATAFSLASELQSEFAALRSAMPFWCTKELPPINLGETVAFAEVKRIQDIVLEQLNWSGGPYLFGKYSVVDAMMLPMMSRFRTYGLTLRSDVQLYQDFVLSSSTYRRWVAEATEERVQLERLERDATAYCT